MCGRYASTVDASLLAADLDAIDETEGQRAASYNVAPTVPILTLIPGRSDDPDRERMRLREMRWGLIPYWTKATEPGVPVKGKPLFNARADSVTTTASFRDSFASKRCLIPIDGWYEWRIESESDGKSAKKTPFYMHPADGSELFLAGVWARWRDGDTVLDSATILTTDAVGHLTDVHDRMPLILPREVWQRWLTGSPEQAEALLPGGLYDGPIEAREVSSLVNNWRNDGPELLEPADTTRLF